MGEASRRQAVKPDPIKTEPVIPTGEQPGGLTVDDINAMLRSYQQQITQQAGQIATQAMQLARYEREIVRLKAK